MKVLFLTIGSEIAASSRTRVYQYLPYLRRTGVGYKTISLDFEKIGLHPIRKFISLPVNLILIFLRIIKFIFMCPSYDVVFIQKILFPVWTQKLIKRLNDNIVFDFDDAIYLSQGEIYASHCHGDVQINPRFVHMISISKCIFLENEDNEKVASRYLQRDSKIVRITGPIDTHKYFPKPKANTKEVIIGWVGSPSTTPYLKPLEKVFGSLSKRYPNLKIELVGAAPLQMDDVKIEMKKWSLDTEVTDIQNFDIGIMPIPDNLWTRGKGGYKLLQYMAVGIPCMASPVGVNKEIIINGINGFLCESGEDWEEKLSVLIESQQLRNSMGKAGRELALKKYSLSACAQLFIDCVKKANCVR